jgi:hypothetical protein
MRSGVANDTLQRRRLAVHDMAAPFLDEEGFKLSGKRKLAMLTAIRRWIAASSS